MTERFRMRRAWGVCVAAMLAAGAGCDGVDGGTDAGDVPAADVGDAGDVPGADLVDATGDGGGDAGPSDVPKGDLPEVVPGTPILERPTDLRFDCEVSRAVVDHGPLAWTRDTHAPVTTTAGKTFLARLEAVRPDFAIDGPSRLLVGPFGRDGTVGDALEIPSEPYNVRGMAVVPAGEGFLMAWTENGLKTALRDADGGASAAPRTLAGQGGDYWSRPSLAFLGNGFGLAWSAPAGGTTRATRLLRLDRLGAPVGTAVDLATSETDVFEMAPRIAAGSGRWGVLWHEVAGQRGHVKFAAVDEAGNVVVAPRRVSSVDEDGVIVGGEAFARARAALMAHGTGWVAAWAEVRWGVDFQSGASVTIKVARLDADGDVLEEAPVRTTTEDVDEVEPVLVPYEGVAALFWSTGDHIYFCAGCVPNHRVDLVLLDPATLAPVSEVVSVAPAGGGFLDVQPTVAGDEFLFTFSNRFHVHEESRSAAVRCTPR